MTQLLLSIVRTLPSIATFSLKLFQPKVTLVDDFEIIASGNLILALDQVIHGPIRRDEAAGQEPRSISGEPNAGTTDELGRIEGEALEGFYAMSA